MKSKTFYLLPAFAAVFALMFVVATPSIMADSHEDVIDEKKAMWKDAKKHKQHKKIEVEGFVGTIPVPEDVNRESFQELKDQVTVSLSEAADGLDVMRASIGVAVNENGEKFVVWKLASVNPDEGTVTIYVVDAGDATNTTTVTKEINHSKSDRRADAKFTDAEKLENRIQKIEQRSSDGAGNSDSNEFKVELLSLVKQMQTAITDGDDVQVDSIKDQLKELREQMIDLKRFK